MNVYYYAVEEIAGTSWYWYCVSLTSLLHNTILWVYYLERGQPRCYQSIFKFKHVHTSVCDVCAFMDPCTYVWRCVGVQTKVIDAWISYTALPSPLPEDELRSFAYIVVTSSKTTAAMLPFDVIALSWSFWGIWNGGRGDPRVFIYHFVVAAVSGWFETIVALTIMLSVTSDKTAATKLPFDTISLNWGVWGRYAMGRRGPTLRWLA